MAVSLPPQTYLLSSFQKGWSINSNMASARGYHCPTETLTLIEAPFQISKEASGLPAVWNRFGKLGHIASGVSSLSCFNERFLRRSAASDIIPPVTSPSISQMMAGGIEN